MLRQLINDYLWYRGDCFFLSFPKSGRTWVRSILRHYYSLYYDIPRVDSFLPIIRVGSKRHIPRIIFSHTNPRSSDFSNTRRIISNISGKPVILQVRNPRTVVLTYYFQVIKRANITEAKTLSFPKFVRHPVMGINRIIQFMNTVYELRANYSRFTLARYEDHLSNTAAELARILQFLDTPVDEQVLARAIELSTDTTREIEIDGLSQLIAINRGDPPESGSAEDRKWNLNRYTDYLEATDLGYLEHCMEALNPDFGYHGAV